MAMTFRSTRFADEPRSANLQLWYELNGSSMSDEYAPQEIDAYELLRRWADRYTGPDGFVSIYWSVFDDQVSLFETAPFQEVYGEDFLTHFTWPVDEGGSEINWLTLPVADLGWNGSISDKGGFIQEATAWKPAPFQDRVRVSTLLNNAIRP